ncbi:MAG: transposase [Victivallales bacterium]|nr:transposase [Victivallales bacterium]
MGLVKNKESTLYRIGGMPDHLHLFVELVTKLSLSDFVRELKTSTGKWLTNNPLFPYFQGWGKGYAAFTYSQRKRTRSSITLRRRRSIIDVTCLRRNCGLCLRNMDALLMEYTS